MSVNGRYKKSPRLYRLSPSGEPAKTKAFPTQSLRFRVTTLLAGKIRPLIRRPVPLRRKA